MSEVAFVYVGRGAGMALRCATAVVPRSQRLRGAAARKARGCAVGNELALRANTRRRA